MNPAFSRRRFLKTAASAALLGEPPQMRAWLIPARLLRPGINRLELSLSGGVGSTVELIDLSA